MKLLPILVGLCMAFSCARQLPEAYKRSLASAERAYSAGRYEKAAQAWLRAAQHATNRRDRDEAEFRAASSFERLGQAHTALQMYRALLKRSPGGERAARARYQMALVQRQLGHSSRYAQGLLEVIYRYPDSGLAGPALDAYISWLDQHQGERRVLEALKDFHRRHTQGKLAERSAYRLAQQLERTGALEEALATYVETAERFLYPNGAYRDDCLYRAALLERRLGRKWRAISHLNVLLGDRERASLQGSYERSRYAQAQFLKAEIYRDDLNDAQRARRAFHKVFVNFETSLLRDDALWNEAQIASRTGDVQGACNALRLLGQTLPDSRYAACSYVMCPVLTSTRRCHPYILEALEPSRR